MLSTSINVNNTRKRKRNRSRRNNSSTAITIAPANNLPRGGRSKRSRRPRKRNRTNRNAPVPMADSMVTRYINTLNNPFEHGPIKLGWGTFVPTNTYTAYLRYTLTSSSDGYFGIFFWPSLCTTTSGLYNNNATAGAATWTPGAGFANATAIGAAINEARVVSGGIKVLPQVPATALPGVLYVGSCPSGSTAGLTTLTIPNLATQPFMKVGYGSTGGCALVHPIDPVSFEFQYNTINGPTSTSALNFSTIPMICGTGFPANTPVYVEVVLNLEGVVSTASASTAITNPEIDNDDADTLVDSFSSVEAMWRVVKRFVPTSAQLNEGASMIRNIGNTALSLNYAYQRARSSYFRTPPQNRVTVEEIE